MFGKFNLENRRYIGNKNKLATWIKELLNEYASGNSFFDVFAGTGVVTREVLDIYDEFVLNDFLFSNNIIYTAFFDTSQHDCSKLKDITNDFRKITDRKFDDSYFEDNYGGKFFSFHDAKIIGEIRERIELNDSLNHKEKAILIASLIYSADKIANTVGHYDAYRKKERVQNKFKFELINPINAENKDIKIYREDSNELIRNVKADIAFVDPPYNSRQYSRFYHVLEGISKWDKPKLSGVAMKPKAENMSTYCKTSAPMVFNDLISNLDVNYIAVTYNNNYKSKSNSSRNKITHEEILNSLENVGTTNIFEKSFKFFNAGKSDLQNHKEFLFITEVNK
ncbi:DNA adenine methylase [Methanobrevibacter curvatus]|uniref:site-specific DNA-methyltransferase (adenine-specific) n=1 Tax=Methanobrevibacter curvatus TaxID=49547 RepID=A0A162FIT9_9EURY|nr:DNA adenine methylase [Methanobrevibacter curvatus]KZX10630.1 modification methylase FokI [Methanobrevibacter curvatus]